MSAHKIVLLLLVAGLGIVLLLPDLTAMGARKALSQDYRNEPWAPGVVYLGGKVNMRFWRYAQARSLLQQGLEIFPKAHWAPEGRFYIALCFEGQGQSKEAVQWYEKFLAATPYHRWNDQARKRISNLEAAQ